MSQEQKGIYEFGPFSFEPQQCVLLRDGVPKALTPKSANLLAILLRYHGRIVEKEELFRQVWPGTFVADGTLTFHIHLLRDVLGDGPDGNGYIETVPRRGYRFSAPIKFADLSQSQLAQSIFRTGTPASPQGSSYQAEKSQHPADQQPRIQRWGIYATAVAAACLIIGAIVLFSASAPTTLHLACCTQITHDGIPKVSGFLASDGVSLFFKEGTAHGERAYTVSVEGGETGPLPNIPVQFDLLDLSPKGNEFLAFRNDPAESDYALWTIPIPAGSPRNLTNLKGIGASWSPDGRLIAFSSSNSIYLANADGGNARKIADLPGSGILLCWSPDSARIRFVLEFPNRQGGELWEVRSAGGGLRPVFADRKGGSSVEGGASWSADGRDFFFVYRHQGSSDVWMLPESRTVIQTTAQTPYRATTAPFEVQAIAPSRDGKKLFAIGTYSMPEITRFDSRLRAFVPYEEFSSTPAYWVTFSSKRDKIAYTTYRDENLWIANADGTNRVQLTFPPMHVVGISWSPDGSRLAVRAQNPGQHWKISIVSPNGGSLRELETAARDAGVPTWSADGTKLVYGDVPVVWGNAEGDEELHVYDLRTNKTYPLLGSQGLWTSRWSPDGKHIAALSIREQELMLYDFATDRWRSSGVKRVNELMWARDGKSIFYETLKPDVTIDQIQIASGKVKMLIDLSGYPRLEQGFTLDAEDRPIVLHNKSTSEIYAFNIERR